MEEKESKQGKDLAQERKKQDKIKEAIELALLNNKGKVILDDGKSTIKLDLMKINTDGDERFSVWIDEDTKMAVVSKWY